MSALDTFRRAMRRHEKRAREQRVGFGAVEDIIRCHRLQPLPDSEHFLRGLAQSRRVRLAEDRSDPTNRRAAFLYERAADAVTRYRDALRREEEQAEDDAPPYVCAECHCVGPDPHAPGCQEAILELPFGPDDEEDDALDPCDIECLFCGFPTFDCQCDDEEDDDVQSA